MSDQIKGKSVAELQRIAKETAAKLSDMSKRGRFMLYRPHRDQAEWFASKKQIICILCGNQRGKTTAGAIKVISAATGIKPESLGGAMPSSWDTIDCSGRRFLLVADSFDTVIPKTIVPKIKSYLAPGMLAGKPRMRSGGRVEQIFYFASGAELHIQSYEQDPDSFEGPVWDGAWFDEPPPQRIFNAVRRGCIAKQGWIWITGTPIKEPWMRDVLVKPSEDEDDPMFKFCDVFTGRMHDNCQQCNGGYLPHDYIEAFLASLSPEERAARERGEFMDATVLAFPHVSDQTHVTGDIW